MITVHFTRRGAGMHTDFTMEMSREDFHRLVDIGKKFYLNSEPFEVFKIEYTAHDACVYLSKFNDNKS